MEKKKKKKALLKYTLLLIYSCSKYLWRTYYAKCGSKYRFILGKKTDRIPAL